MSKSVAIFLAEGFEEIEALTVVDVLRRAGISIDTVSVTGKLTVTGSHSIPVTSDKLLEDVVNSDAYDMLVFPGGMPGTKNLEANTSLMGMLDRYNANGKLISAICAAPTIFGHKGYLVGKNACCYPGMEDGLNGATVSFNSVTVDGNIITSRGMGTAIDFSLKLLDVLGEGTPSAELASKIVYK